MLKMPPRVKVLEALGAIADGRVKVIDDTKAEVISSEGDRKYKVYYYENLNAANSTDNGTKFRHYVGYPIIAFLMLKGKLPFDKRFSEALKGIDWKKVNSTFKDYSKTEEFALEKAKEHGVDPNELKEFVSRVMEEIKKLKLVYPWEAK